MRKKLFEGWKFRLDSKLAKDLRGAIDREDYQALRTALEDSWRFLYNTINDEDILSESELETKIDDLEFLDVEPNSEIDVYDDDIEDNFNYELSDFYDFCDAFRIWIPLHESMNKGSALKEDYEIQEWMIDDALKVVNDALYELDDNVHFAVEELLGLDKARKQLDNAFHKAYKYLIKNNPESKLIKKYNLF